MSTPAQLYPICAPDHDPMLERVIAKCCGHMDERRKIKHDYCGRCLANDRTAWYIAHPGVIRSIWSKLSPFPRRRPSKADLTKLTLEDRLVYNAAVSSARQLARPSCPNRPFHKGLIALHAAELAEKYRVTDSDRPQMSSSELWEEQISREANQALKKTAS